MWTVIPEKEEIIEVGSVISVNILPGGTFWSIVKGESEVQQQSWWTEEIRTRGQEVVEHSFIEEVATQ